MCPPKKQWKGKQPQKKETAKNTPEKEKKQEEAPKGAQGLLELKNSSRRGKKKAEKQVQREQKKTIDPANFVVNQEQKVKKIEYPTYTKKIDSYETMIEAIDVVQQKFDLKKITSLNNLLSSIKARLQGSFYESNQEEMKVFIEIIRFTLNYDFNEKDNIIKVFVTNIERSYQGLDFLLQIPPKALKIAKGLFKMSFMHKLINNQQFPTFLPVLGKALEFIYEKSPVLSFKGVTGSGKTRCMPFILAIRAVIEKLDQPFIIMSQPSISIVKDKERDFANFFSKEDVIVTTEIKELMRLYRNSKKLQVPVVGILSPIKILKLLKMCDIYRETRFILDEVHERPVELDVLIACISQNINYQKSMQVFLMTATPDPRIAKCFNNMIQNSTIYEDTLFPVFENKIRIDKWRDIPPYAVDELFNILNDINSRKYKPGHVLIFMSGNSRIKEVCTNINEKWKNKFNEHSNIALLNIPESVLANQEECDKVLENSVTDPRKLYVLPIPYAGYRSENQKKLAKYNIDKYNNIIKVVIATDAIESSITIDNLVAVIDSCLSNVPEFDMNTGITCLHEEPISIQSIEQRKGRVGRVRKGQYIRFYRKEGENEQTSIPTIETTDLSTTIIDLRYIDYRLEDIKNLPDPVNPDRLNEAFQILKKCGALDEEANLTDRGIEIREFNPISPYMAASIIDLSKNENLLKIPEDKCSEVVKLFGAFVILIASESGLVLEPLNEKLSKFYNTNSDIMTAISAIFSLVNERGDIKKNSLTYGFNQKSVVNITGKTIDYAKKLKIIDEKAKPIQVWKILESFYQKCDFHKKFTDAFLECINKNNSEWIEIHTIDYKGLYNVLETEKMLFEGSPKLSFSEKRGSRSKALIKCGQRFGTPNLDIPLKCLVWNINRNRTKNTNYGQFLHSLTSDRAKFASTSIPEHLNNSYTIDILNKLINKSMLYGYITNDYLGNNGSNNVLFYIPKNQNIIKFNPIGKFFDDAVKSFQVAVDKISKIMPYIPTAMVRRNDYNDKCLITGNNAGNLTLKIDNFIQYEFDSQAINYILSHIEKIGQTLFTAISENGGIVVVSTTPIPLNDRSSHFNKFANEYDGNYSSSNVHQMFNIIDYPRSNVYSGTAEIDGEKMTIIDRSTMKAFAEKVLVNDFISKQFKFEIQENFTNYYYSFEMIAPQISCPQQFLPPNELDEEGKIIPRDPERTPEKDNRFYLGIKKVVALFNGLARILNITETYAKLELPMDFYKAFVNELEEEFYPKADGNLIIPDSVTPKIFQDNPIFFEKFKAWLTDHNLKLELRQSKFYGPHRYLEQAKYYLAKEKPKININSRFLRFDYDSEELIKFVQKYNRHKSASQCIYVNKNEFLIVLPDDVDIDFNKFIIAKTELQDICNCNAKNLSSVILYDFASPDKHQCFCTKCMHKILTYAAYSSSSEIPPFYQLNIPFAQFASFIENEKLIDSGLLELFIGKLCKKEFDKFKEEMIKKHQEQREQERRARQMLFQQSSGYLRDIFGRY